MIAVGSTWRVFSQTNDEPAHLAAGMQWLEQGRYTYEPKHPPLPRILFALGPWLRGIPWIEAGDLTDQGNNILDHQGRYSSNLSLARAGNLPFLLLGIVVVALWSRHLYGPWAAVISTLLFATAPPVLGLAGVAANDLAAAATIAATLFTFQLWLESPTPRRTIAFSLSAAVALLSKFTSVSYLPIALVIALIFTALTRKPPARRLARMLPIALVVFFLCVWAVYRFSFAPVLTPENAARYDEVIPASIRPPMKSLLASPLPAPELLRGVGDVLLHNWFGHYGYFFGERGREGWTAYFPVVLAIKTPLPLLLLSLGAIAIPFVDLRTSVQRVSAETHRPLTTGHRPHRRWDRLIPLLAAISILGVAMTSSINIGLRHILPIYPLLAVAAGGTAIWLWQKRTMLTRALVILLAGWQLTSSVIAHPDHLAWFNEIAPENPEDWVLDSNIDWGQDLLRLSRELRRRKIESLSLGYFGTAIPSRHKIPPFRLIDPYNPGEGWVAISLMNLYLRPDHESDAYFWLTREKPERIGKSLLLYRVPRVERILLPVLLGPEPLRDAGGRRWVTNVVIQSRSTRPVSAFLGSRKIEIAPGRSVPALLSRNELGGAFLDLPASVANQIDVSLSLDEGQSGRKNPVPVVSQETLSPGTQTLTPPKNGGSLRVYQVAPGRKSKVLIRARRGAEILSEMRLPTARFTEGGPLFAETDVSTFGLDDPAGLVIDVVPADPNERLWVLLVEPGSDPSVVRFQPSEPSE